MRKIVVAVAFAAAASAWSEEPLQRPAGPIYRIEQAPARLASGIGAADAAITALQRRLAARLQDELRKGGPELAFGVCRDEAQTLTAESARASGLRVGRTSHRLRNPRNVAPAWAEQLVAAGAGRTAATLEASVVDLSDHVGVLRPISTAGMCLQCHGVAERLSPTVTALLETAYPDDRAVGFAEGELRGFIWAEAPVQPATPRAPATPDQDAGDLATGRQLFGEANPRCTMCHSAAGKGNPQGPPLDGIGARLTRSEIKAWLRDPVEMAKQRGTTRKPAMLPYPEFSDEELDALAAYVASLEPRPQK